ncbi:MAG: lytic transglycosylase [Gammaproteobacteria bacterium HGW-Gammaproteobacteria-3]|nr:MAG: lytic transglycosylase [Gammaproteobacteria bacterium HGW-Gammaproteobacteria-3]
MNWKELLLAGLLVFNAALACATEQKPEAIRKSAQAYEHGRGVNQDYVRAFELYCKAALLGDAESAYNLGFMYFNGRGRHRDPARAKHWFGLAVGRGDRYAKRMMRKFRGIEANEDPTCKPKPKLQLSSDPNRQIIAQWVGQIAPQYGIDPELVLAVIQAESAFKPKALSNKNARGLMQLIPATAERFGVKDCWNPIQNIKGGTAYLNWLMRHFEGNVEWVLAAYNAGEGAVERYQGVPPYQETRQYVKQILQHYPKTRHPIPPDNLFEALAEPQNEPFDL